MVLNLADIQSAIRPKLHAKGLAHVARRPIANRRIDEPLGGIGSRTAKRRNKKR